MSNTKVVKRIMPKRVIDDTEIVISMRTRTILLSTPISEQQIRHNAERIIRLIGSIVKAGGICT